MDEFIKTRIEGAGDRSIEEGQSKYLFYFPNTRGKYEKHRLKVNQSLTLEGYSRCIVEIA